MSAAIWNRSPPHNNNNNNNNNNDNDSDSDNDNENNNQNETLSFLLEQAKDIINSNQNLLQLIASRQGEEVVTHRSYSVEKVNCAFVAKLSHSAAVTGSNTVTAAVEEMKPAFLQSSKRNDEHNKDGRGGGNAGGSGSSGDDDAEQEPSSSPSSSSKPKPPTEIKESTSTQQLMDILVEKRTLKPIDDLIHNWKYQGAALQKEVVVFDGFIDLKCQVFDDVKRLERSFENLHEKYSRILVDQELTRRAALTLLQNMTKLQTAVMEVYALTVDVSESDGSY